MRSSQLHGGIRRLSRWTTLALTIFLLTCPLVVLQVQVAPGSSLQLPPEGSKGRTFGCWQVSSQGRYRNSRGGISHGCLKSSGYCVVKICGSDFPVHRLVAHAFLRPPPSKAAWEVNHIDGNCSNNRKDNLEWATRSDNVRHSYATNPSRGNAGSKRARPVMIRTLGSCNQTRFSSIKLAAQKLGQLSATVRNRCHKNLQMDGYEYKFAPVQQVELPGEEWRPMIDPRSGGRVGGRMISSLGRITSKAGRISFGSVRKDGYLQKKIKLGSNSQYQTEFVHRLVAASFLGLPPSPEHSQVNHKDSNKSNNAVENLEYLTPSENIAHRFACQKGGNPLSKAVLSRAYATNEEWTAHPSMTSAAETLRLHLSCVSACARGARKQTGGYELRFAELEPSVVETLPREEWRDVDLDAHLEDKERRKRRQRQRRHMKVQWRWVALLMFFFPWIWDMIWFWFTSSLMLFYLYRWSWVMNMGRHLKAPPLVLFHKKSSAWASDNMFAFKCVLFGITWYSPPSWKSLQLCEAVFQMAMFDPDDTGYICFNSVHVRVQSTSVSYLKACKLFQVNTCLDGNMDNKHVEHSATAPELVCTPTLMFCC